MKELDLFKLERRKSKNNMNQKVEKEKSLMLILFSKSNMFDMSNEVIACNKPSLNQENPRDFQDRCQKVDKCSIESMKA